MEDTIWIEKPNSYKGVSMNRKKYYLIRDAILSTVQEKSVITLEELIDMTKQKLSRSSIHEIAWDFLMAKQDLETKGILKSIIGVEPTRNN